MVLQVHEYCRGLFFSLDLFPVTQGLVASQQQQRARDAMQMSLIICIIQTFRNVFSLIYLDAGLLAQHDQLPWLASPLISISFVLLLSNCVPANLSSCCPFIFFGLPCPRLPMDLLPNEHNFDLDNSRQKFHYSLKEYHKISNNSNISKLLY